MPRKNRSIKHQPYSANLPSCGKRRFNNANDAQAAAEFQMLQDMNLELAIYQCDSCRHWHLTRNTDNKII